MAVSLSFQNEHIIYENEVRCIVRESDFNLSYNPTLLKYDTATLTNSSISAVSNIILSSPQGIQTTFTTSITFPYDIILNYIINWDIAGIPSMSESTIILPAGSSTVVDFIPLITAPLININNTIIISKQYSIADSTVKDFATGSFFQPYVTTIGLYNDNNDLLMVAKLGKPIALSSDTDMTFIVKYDT
jgi:hypothetical protein